MVVTVTDRTEVHGVFEDLKQRIALVATVYPRFHLGFQGNVHDHGVYWCESESMWGVRSRRQMVRWLCYRLIVCLMNWGEAFSFSFSRHFSAKAGGQSNGVDEMDCLGAIRVLHFLNVSSSSEREGYFGPCVFVRSVCSSSCSLE